MKEFDFCKIFDENKIEWFYSGSRVYGVNKNESDYDICIKTSDKYYNIINEYLESKKFEKEESNYVNGFYVTIEGEKINFIPLPEEIFNIWKKCTDSITAICQKNNDIMKIMCQKEKRIALFELLKGFYRIA